MDTRALLVTGRNFFLLYPRLYLRSSANVMVFKGVENQGLVEDLVVLHYIVDELHHLYLLVG